MIYFAGARAPRARIVESSTNPKPSFCRELEWVRFVCFWVFLSMVATKGHVCREPGQINYGQAPPFISTNMGSWRTPLNSNRDCFSVYPQFTAASCCIQRGPRSSKLMCTLRGKSKGGGAAWNISVARGPPLGGGYISPSYSHCCWFIPY